MIKMAGATRDQRLSTLNECASMWGGKPRLLSPDCKVDACMIAPDKTVISWIIVEFRDVRAGYPDKVVVALDRWRGARAEGEVTGLPALLVVQFKNGIKWARLDTCDSEIGVGSLDPADVCAEPLVFIPISQFRDL